jgi:hypothetical protein
LSLTITAIGSAALTGVDNDFMRATSTSASSAACSKFGAENPQVLHIPRQQFSTKDQNEKIRMAAAEHKREVATAEPLLAGFAVSCMK